MAKLITLGKGQGYLKAGFLGFQKSGKTYTSMLLAIGTRTMMNHQGPIAMFDTEGGSEYIADTVRNCTGLDLVGLKSRSFDDLMQVAQDCVDERISVLIVDSVTHIWRELCEAYLKQINDQRQALAKEKGWTFKKKQSLEFQDWAHVKNIWSKWTDFYLNSPLHIIIAGRAGFEYDMQKNEDTGKNELIKTGMKMKTEGEFGFEPSLLVEMEREQAPDGQGGFRIQRRATVIGDRFNAVDAHSILFPSFEGNVEKEMDAVMKFFHPHVSRLKPDAHVPIDTSIKTNTGADEFGDTEWGREKKARTILSEEIQGLLVAYYPGQDGESKSTKMNLLYEHFQTRSWTAVEGMSSEKLREGLSNLKKKLEAAQEVKVSSQSTTTETTMFTKDGSLNKDASSLPEKAKRSRKAQQKKEAA